MTDRAFTPLRRRKSAYIWAAFAILFIRLCIMPLGSSLGLDELGTSWIISGSLPQAITRALNWHPQSALYMAIEWMFQDAAGSSEMALRLPSLIAYSLAVLMVYKLGKRLVDTESALLASIAFLAITSYYACDARPYALALLTSTAAVWYLIGWLDSGKTLDGLRYVLLSAGAVYFHFLYAILWLPHLAYVLVKMRSGSRVTWAQLAGAIALLGLCVAPLAPQLLLASHSNGILGAFKPPLLTLFEEFAPAFLLVAILGGTLACAVLLADFRYAPMALPPSAMTLLVCWATAAQLTLFVISYLIPSKLFIPRYWSSVGPGLALLIAWAVRGFEPRRARTIITLVIAGCAFLINGGAKLKVRHNAENWRDAMAAVRAAAGPQIPVLFRGAFIEADDPGFFSDPANRGIILAPLSRYPATGRVIPLPYRANPRTLGDLESVVRNQLESSQSFLLVSSDDEGGFRTWLDVRLQPAGFRSRPLGDFGAVSVDLFERAGPGGDSWLRDPVFHVRDADYTLMCVRPPASAKGRSPVMAAALRQVMSAAGVSTVVEPDIVRAGHPVK